ncbi:glycosyltransferase family 2 protein [Phocaeicola faecium]|uniref:Glycosyltransferase n=1 Tax=Phocaeicola faecium TaxID=2762213 RepID=A0ABR8VGA5_9BACT|nr:glycosyltransferase family 2 protein [Phocaeicola faecium]MBD8003441.1 glycosyltransferase [Phocaeicola faecium]
MMNTPCISVIIPCYNVDSYIEECVKSVISQTFRDIEIIIVDDGSTDSSPQICEELAKQDSRIRIVHKINGGLSDARNVGTQMAVGEFIFYLDGDDRLVSDALYLLYGIAKDKNADIVQGNFYYDYSQYFLVDNRFLKSNAVISLSGVKAMGELLKNRFIKNFAWGKLIKTSLAKKHPFVKGVYFEDSYWMYLLIDETRNYTIVNVPIYYYRQRNGSISGRFSLRQLDLLKGMEQRLLFILKKYPMFIDLAMNKYWEMAFTFFYFCQKEYRSQYEDYWCSLNIKYKVQIRKSIKKSFRLFCLYHLQEQAPPFLSAWFFFERIYQRLFSKKLIKIFHV